MTKHTCLNEAIDARKAHTNPLAFEIVNLGGFWIVRPTSDQEVY